MFAWLKRNKTIKHIFKVEYVQCGLIDDNNKAIFDLNDMQEMLIEATDLMDAQKIFVEHTMITPHVYVHRISQIDPKIHKAIA